MRSTILLLPFTSIKHYEKPSIDNATLIRMVPLKTGGNVGGFASWHQGSNETSSRSLSLLVEKEYKWIKKYDWIL